MTTKKDDEQTRAALAHRQHERMGPAGRIGTHRTCGRAVGADEDEHGRLVNLGEACTRTQGHSGACEVQS